MVRYLDRGLALGVLLSALTITGADVKCYSCSRCKPPFRPESQPTTKCFDSECVGEVTGFLNGTRIYYYGCPKSEHTAPAGGTRFVGSISNVIKEAYVNSYMRTTGELSNNNLIAPIDPCSPQAVAGSLQSKTSLVMCFCLASLIAYLRLI